MIPWLDALIRLFRKALITTDSGGMTISENTTLKPGVYYLPEGITIARDGITLDGNGAVIIGQDRKGRGVVLEGRNGVTVKNLTLRDYYHGIYAYQCKNLTISGCQITSTAEVAANTIFLDIWLGATQAYGGGIFLWDVTDSTVHANDLQHQMNGLLTYHCQRLTVTENIANYCSGYGLHLFDTSDSLFEENFADYCSRWQPRGGRTGHMGADATGFLIVSGSSRNKFLRNYARLGGDGFFMAGLNPQFEHKPCNDNLFEENDASYSPNIGFEATFCANNTFRNNITNHCNYGFWLGFSSSSTLQNNQMQYCGQAGIAVENGYDFTVQENTFLGNTHGILLWSKHIPQFANTVPKNDTSYNWTIERNTFQQNAKAIRIAADQDHGIRPYQPGAPQPHDHIIRANTIRDNRLGIELAGAEMTLIEGNVMEDNAEVDKV